MMYLGDYASGETVHFMWSTNAADGSSVTRATNGTISVYKDDNTTQTTTGVADTEDFDALTGVHHCKIATSDGFYTTATDYTVVLSAATIDGKTVNAVLAHFSIQNRYMRGTDSANTTTPPTAGTIADAVWDEATSGHTTAGSAGKALTDANNGTPPTAAAIADQVWDEALAGHATAGSTGEALAAADLSGVVDVAVAEVATGAEPTTVGGLLRMLYNRFYRRSELTNTTLKTYVKDGAGGGSGVLTSQTVSDDGTTQIQQQATYPS